MADRKNESIPNVPSSGAGDPCPMYQSPSKHRAILIRVLEGYKNGTSYLVLQSTTNYTLLKVGQCVEMC